MFKEDLRLSKNSIWVAEDDRQLFLQFAFADRFELFLRHKEDDRSVGSYFIRIMHGKYQVGNFRSARQYVEHIAVFRRLFKSDIVMGARRL